jgi:hypothetical protein
MKKEKTDWVVRILSSDMWCGSKKERIVFYTVIFTLTALGYIWANAHWDAIRGFVLGYLLWGLYNICKRGYLLAFKPGSLPRNKFPNLYR